MKKIKYVTDIQKYSKIFKEIFKNIQKLRNNRIRVSENGQFHVVCQRFMESRKGLSKNRFYNKKEKS